MLTWSGGGGGNYGVTTVGSLVMPLRIFDGKRIKGGIAIRLQILQIGYS